MSTPDRQFLCQCSKPWSLTWQVPDVHTAQVPQSIFVVVGVVPHDAMVFTGEVVEPAMDRGHSGEVIQRLLNILNDILQEKRAHTELKQMQPFNSKKRF